MGETRRDVKQASLPEDVALEIASYLQVSERSVLDFISYAALILSNRSRELNCLIVDRFASLGFWFDREVGDLCGLGSCSRFWRDLWGSDFLWESPTRQRWPSLDLFTESSSVDRGDSSSSKGWRDFYVKCHTEMAERAMSVVKIVEQCSFLDSLEIRDYRKAIERLDSMQLGFKDVEMFLFRPEVNVLLNLVGLHYCMRWLEVPAEHVMEALRSSKISQRQVCVKWWNLSRLFYGLLMRHKPHIRLVSLQDLALPEKNEVLAMLHLPFMMSSASRFPFSILIALPGLSRSTQVCD